MDELELSGKRYISTRRAGRENGYHSDYIGQLIRGGKVVGQKVGRSWYVDEESLAVYLGKAYTSPAPTKEESVPVAAALSVESTPVIEVSVQPQQPPTAAQVVSTIGQVQTPQKPTEEYTVPIHIPAPVPIHQKPVVEEKVSPVGLRYIEDDKDTLLPVVTRMPEEEYAREQLIPPMPVRRSSKIGRIALIAGAMVLVVGVSVAASAFLNVTVRVNNDQTATVFYSVKN